MTEIVDVGVRNHKSQIGNHRSPVADGTSARPLDAGTSQSRTTAYVVSVGQLEYSVEIGEAGLWVNGEPVAFELASLNGNGLHLFRRGVKSMELYFKTEPVGADTRRYTTPDHRRTGDHADYEVSVNGQHLMARVDRADRRRRAAKVMDANGAVRSPMPGLIVDVLVEVGQCVEQGQPLLTQESMKMQMQLRAPCAGRVTAITVSPGEQVAKDAALVHVSRD
jgi:biotin carboxyl carrier protein